MKNECLRKRFAFVALVAGGALCVLAQPPRPTPTPEGRIRGERRHTKRDEFRQSTARQHEQVKQPFQVRRVAATGTIRSRFDQTLSHDPLSSRPAIQTNAMDTTPSSSVAASTITSALKSTTAAATSQRPPGAVALPAKSPQGGQGAGQGKEPMREVLESLAPQERQIAGPYVRNLDPEERNILRRTLEPLPPDQRKAKLLSMANANEKPKSEGDLLRERIGIPAVPKMTPMVIAAANPGKGQFSSHALGVTSKMPGVGDQAPGFSLESPDGSRVSLSSYRGRSVVLEFGSITSPVYRGKIGSINNLAFQDKDKAAFLLIYTIEANPKGSNSPYADHEWVPEKNTLQNVQFAQPADMVQRKELAANVIERFGEKLPIAVDTMDNETWKAYGARANSAFLIGPDGKIAAVQEWADADMLAAKLRLTTQTVAAK